MQREQKVIKPDAREPFPTAYFSLVIVQNSKGEFLAVKETRNRGRSATGPASGIHLHSRLVDSWWPSGTRRNVRTYMFILLQSSCVANRIVVQSDRGSQAGMSGTLQKAFNNIFISF
jgi:hypothetical protein